MSDTYTDKAAFEKLTKAKFQMFKELPFFAHISLSLPVHEAPWLPIPTMATDMVNLYYHPKFVKKCTMNQLIAVLMHEVLHVAFMHGTRRQNRDPKLWNFACDYAINLIVTDSGFTLPGQCLIDEKYRDWSAQRIYADLMQNQDKINKMLDKMPMFGGNGEGGEGSDDDSKFDETIHGGVIDLRDFKDADGNQMKPEEVEHAIRMRVANAVEHAKSRGKVPGGIEGLIKAMGQPEVNWHDYIVQWVKGHTPDDFTWVRPNKRIMANFGVIMPSIVFRGAGIGVLSIDESGSVSDQELQKYAAEITGLIELCKPEKLIIILHDAIVQKVYEWEPGMDFDGLQVKGRGGTCIQPVFEHIKTLDDDISWMICFTDMGIFDYPPPHEAPDYPVLWAATGPDNAPFGTYIPVKHALDR